MKPLVQKILFSLVAVTLVSASCRKGGPCEEAPNLSTSEVIVTFRDKAGEYLYKEINPPCNKDSLKVFDERGNQLLLLSQFNQIPNTGLNYYEISFGTIYDNSTDQASFNSELCKQYIIQYRYNERDTVQTCFKADKTKCGSVFKTLRVYHKGQLLTSVQNTTFAQVTLIKP